MKKTLNRKRLVAMLMNSLEICEYFLKDKAHIMSKDFMFVLELPEEDLPLHVHDNGFLGELVKERLAKRDCDIPVWHVKVLYDVAFNYEDYRALGNNDGELRIIAEVLKELGEDELSNRASDAMYTNNY